MNSAMARLLSAAYRPLSDATPHLSPAIIDQAGRFADELLQLLETRNGFFAFGPALHVFPSRSSGVSWGLAEWNMPTLWKHTYSAFVDPGLCFAEDLFGNQFSIRNDGVYSFQVETGEMRPIATSIDHWAEVILSDDRLWTAWPVAQIWANQYGPLPLHKRLHPARPFVCGGSYEIDNLRPIDAAEMMAKWGTFARQIHDLPDGAQIKFVFDN